jgi:3-oxoacid CoA-transferase subunit A
VFVHRVVALTPEQAVDKRIERRTVRPRPAAAAEEVR